MVKDILTEQDTVTNAKAKQLEALLRNEADLAFKWRVRTAWAYLDPQPGDEILDCGCGLGFYLMALSLLVPCRLCGLDSSLKSLAFAQKQLSQARVGLCLGNIYHLPYDDERFDKVLLVEVLEHLDDDLAALGEVWRVLRPGGVLVVTVPYYRYPFLYDPINWLCERLLHRPIRTGPFAGIWTGHRRLYSRQALLKLMRRARFDVLDCRMLTHYCFPFTHNLIYGLGKGQLQRREWPAFILDAVDRFHPEVGRRDPWNPMTWVMYSIECIDRFNVHIADKKTFVNIAVKARKVKNLSQEVVT